MLVAPPNLTLTTSAGVAYGSVAVAKCGGEGQQLVQHGAAQTLICQECGGQATPRLSSDNQTQLCWNDTLETDCIG